MARQLEPLYDKQCSCRYCEQRFTTKRVRSGSQPVTNRDSDFCTYFDDLTLHPIVYTVYVCPVCGFAYTDSFTRTLSPAARKRVEEKIVSRWVPKSLDGERTLAEAAGAYKLALYAAALTDQPFSVKAGLALRLAWLNRFRSREREEQRFLRLAASWYEESYVQSDYQLAEQEMSEVKLLYLIGELHRRTGNLEQAVHYFSRVTAMKGKTIETGILQLARDQWSLTREDYARRNKLDPSGSGAEQPHV